MGNVIKKKDFDCGQPCGLLRPILYCNGQKSTGLTVYSISLMLTERLLGVRANRRTIKIEAILTEVIQSLPNDAVIQDFDVLFNPDYKIDVLKMLISASKKKTFDVIWPGKYEDGKLFYAEEGYKDFMTFNVKNYDVTCII